ncbi:MAG: hypothetical protein LBU35_03445 [Holosporales bacterium]|nr:hypothetical protein [Holosporales bacterium]
MNKKIKTMASISLAALLMNSNFVLASADVPETPTVKGIFRELGASVLNTTKQHLLDTIAPKLVNLDEEDLEKFLDAIGENICAAGRKFKVIITPDSAENPMGLALVETTSSLLWTYMRPLGRTVKTFARTGLSDTKRRTREGLQGWRRKIGDRARALKQPQISDQIAKEEDE